MVRPHFFLMLEVYFGYTYVPPVVSNVLLHRAGCLAEPESHHE